MPDSPPIITEKPRFCIHPQTFFALRASGNQSEHITFRLDDAMRRGAIRADNAAAETALEGVKLQRLGVPEEFL